MFDVGWGELVLIGVVALIVFGPKELPVVLRTFGQYMTKIRRMAAEFQSQFQEAMREAEMAELKQHFDTIQDAAKGIGSLDPASSIGNPIESAAAEKPPADAAPPGSAANAPVPEPTPAETPAPTQSAAAGPEPSPPAPASAGRPAVAPGPGPPEAGKGQPG
ncbi:MAG: twin-arginine translocase subunit TatB [Alphaproteobacteria bacterium]|nr:MAG: twin-arginine translocase subunit TatB [Alphaproteobacteria bacterium]